MAATRTSGSRRRCAKRSHRPSPGHTRHKARRKADFDKLNQQWRSKEDEVARKITETKRKADGEAYAATESVAEYLAGDLGLKDATPTGYMRATANESEPTPTDIKQFTDMLEAGKVGLLVVNIQEETELTGKIVTAAKSSNIPIVELTEQMPEQYDSLTDWMAALVDAFSPSHLMRTDKKRRESR
mgnify:FL=1